MSTITTRRHDARGSRPTKTIDHRTAQAASSTREPAGCRSSSSCLGPLGAARPRAGPRPPVRHRHADRRHPRPAGGLAELDALAESGAAVALVIVDQGMPEMTGVEFLAGAHKLHPVGQADPPRRARLHEREPDRAGNDARADRLPPRQAVDPGHGLYPAVSEVPRELGELQGARTLHAVSDRGSGEQRPRSRDPGHPDTIHSAVHVHATDSEKGRRSSARWGSRIQRCRRSCGTTGGC